MWFVWFLLFLKAAVSPTAAFCFKGSLGSGVVIFVFAQKSDNFSRFLPATCHLQLAPTCKTPRNPKDPF